MASSIKAMKWHYSLLAALYVTALHLSDPDNTSQLCTMYKKKVVFPNFLGDQNPINGPFFFCFKIRMSHFFSDFQVMSHLINCLLWTCKDLRSSHS